MLVALWTGQATAALQIRLQVGKAEGGALPTVLRDLDAGCVLEAAASVLRCQDARLSFRSEPGGLSELRGRGEWSASGWQAQVLPSTLFGGSVEAQARYSRDARGRGEAEAALQLAGFSYEQANGRYATDKAQLRLDAQARLDGAIAHFDARLSSSAGQAYIEPVFLDFAQNPLELAATGSWDAASRSIRDLQLDGSQRDLIGRLGVNATALRLSPSLFVEQADLQASEARLDGLVSRYLTPFLAGTRWESLSAAGTTDLHLAVTHNAPAAVDLELRSATLRTGPPATAIEHLAGSMHWRRDATAPPSVLSWRAAQ